MAFEVSTTIKSWKRLSYVGKDPADKSFTLTQSPVECDDISQALELHLCTACMSISQPALGEGGKPGAEEQQIWLWQPAITSGENAP